MKPDECKVGMRVRSTIGEYPLATIVEIGQHVLVLIEYEHSNERAWASVHFLEPAPTADEILNATLDAFAKAKTLP